MTCEKTTANARVVGNAYAFPESKTPPVSQDLRIFRA